MNMLRGLLLCACLGHLLVPGSLSAAEPTVSSASEQADRLQALDALEQLLEAYVSGNQTVAKTLVETEMIGYAKVVNAIGETSPLRKQLRLTLSDTRTLVSPGLALIHARWEKRFVVLAGAHAVQQSGHCNFTMRRDGATWRLSALSGDNPFGSD